MSDRKNSEGYSDPTAYQAMMNLEIEELRFKKLLRSIKDVCDLADFEIEGRVVLDEYGGSLSKPRGFAPVLSNLR